MLYLDRKHDPTWWSLKLDDKELNFSKWNFSNGQKIWERVPDWEMAVKILVWLPIAIVGLIGNSTIIIVMIRIKAIRTCTNYFFLNMAIADLITILISSWTILIIDFYQNYALGPFFCRAEGAIQITCLLSSVFSLVAISCDRLLAVTFPLIPRLNKKKALVLIILIWLISLIISSPTIFNRSWHTRQWADYLEVKH
ncbi:substance-K receptor-like [Centruroides sculpturatus]|uniref:substance-K receptor-like n=1 Tax=Centruroides sculpturatus TaxID=218467 RepID=UPI000C6DACD4|nr:substance-K receptor-like [Centruroides sculpturatus]